MPTDTAVLLAAAASFAPPPLLLVNLAAATVRSDGDGTALPVDPVFVAFLLLAPAPLLRGAVDPIPPPEGLLRSPTPRETAASLAVFVRDPTIIVPHSTTIVIHSHNFSKYLKMR